MMHYKIYDDMTPWSEERLQMELSLVSEQRREKVMKMRNATAKQQSLTAYRLLQDMLCETYGITESPIFCTLDNGKPVILGHEDIHFNISHCKKGVACAISDCPVGIDIECIPETVKESLAEYIFNDYELEMLHHSPTPSVVFTRLWTMKEAVVKLSGRGITGKVQLRPLLQPVYENHSPWIFHHIENQELGYVCTIAEDNMDCK